MPPAEGSVTKETKAETSIGSGEMDIQVSSERDSALSSSAVIFNDLLKVQETKDGNTNKLKNVSQMYILFFGPF